METGIIHALKHIIIINIIVIIFVVIVVVVFIIVILFIIIVIINNCLFNYILRKCKKMVQPVPVVAILYL